MGAGVVRVEPPAGWEPGQRPASMVASGSLAGPRGRSHSCKPLLATDWW